MGFNTTVEGGFGEVKAGTVFRIFGRGWMISASLESPAPPG